MLIRKATTNDIREMAKMEEDSFTTDLWNEDMLNYELTVNNTSIFYVAEIDNELVGYINVWEQFDTSSIVQVLTKKEYRNQNIASSLYEYVEKILREKQIQFVTLEVRKSNEPAINLYKKLGFNFICEKPHYYTDGEDALYFVKELL